MVDSPSRIHWLWWGPRLGWTRDVHSFYCPIAGLVGIRRSCSWRDDSLGAPARTARRSKATLVQKTPSLLHAGASFMDWLIASSSRDSIKSGPKAGRCHRWPRSWVRGWAQQTDGIGRAMALGPGGPMALGPFRMAAPMGLKEALRQQAAVLRQVASWPGAGALVTRSGPRATTDLPLAALGAGARGVLNCDLRPPGPAALQISFRSGPVRGFGYVSGEFPIGLNGPDRFCRGGSGHSRFHLKADRHRSPFKRGPGLQGGCNCLISVVRPAA